MSSVADQLEQQIENYETGRLCIYCIHCAILILNDENYRDYGRIHPSWEKLYEYAKQMDLQNADEEKTYIIKCEMFGTVEMNVCYTQSYPVYIKLTFKCKGKTTICDFRKDIITK